MTSISGGISLSDPSVRPLDTSKLKRIHVSELPEEQYQRVMQAQQTILESRYAQRPDISSNPAYKDYATVQVDGKTIATIDNHGWVQSSNAIGAQMGNGLPDSANGVISGPALAQARAEYIAGLFGGEVVPASTAMTQGEFSRTPQPGVTINVQAMKQDPMYESLQRLRQARSAYLAFMDGDSSVSRIA